MKYFILFTLGFLMSNSKVFADLKIVNIEEKQYSAVLTSKAQLVSFPLNKEEINLIEAMKKKLNDLGGVGLAATQVNQSKQILVIYIPEDAALLRERVKPYPMHVMINPSYTPMPQTTINNDFEACYSVLHKAGKVPRYEEIKLSYFDESGQYHQKKEKGFYARVIQHEIDHLNGILIVDRLTPDCVQGSMEEMMALRRAELSEEKRELFDKLIQKKRKANNNN